ncbi:alpha/beta hydrolase [Variovorax rhizosphaerae]|uniref:Alpha/beta hydrolase n=1 Tax=Variovorax rhizosphaerae TaxID=1836200 RepID=A0ABU8WHZ7_9BURK
MTSCAPSAIALFDPPAALQAYAQARALHAFMHRDGLAWYFRDNGRVNDLPPLVLLPGALGNGDTAWQLAEAFETERRVISVTYPGGATPRALAEGLDALLRALVTGPVALWGSSYGAWWAQAFAATYPRQVGALWLGNSLVDGSDVAGAPLFDARWLDTAPTREVIARWHSALTSRPDDLLRSVQLHMLYHGLPASDFHARLRQVAHAPELPAATDVANVLVCGCVDDAVITPRVLERMHQRYPAARRLLLSGGGHYPHIVAPGALIQAMRAWLS